MSDRDFLVPATADDYRLLARRRLPRFLFDYLDGGAGEEITLARNVADFHALRLRQRVMVDVAQVDTGTTMAGAAYDMPVALAPIGLAGLMARRAEVQAVRAAEAARIPFTLSTVGICPLAEVRAASQAPFWFQLYMIRDRGVVRTLLERAAALGVDTLIFTVDLAVYGVRHREKRIGMLGENLAAKLAKARQLVTRPGWIADVALGGKPLTFGNLADIVPGGNDLPAFKRWIDAQMDASVTWADIEWLRSIWHGRLLIKGVMEADDAKIAADIGADGVVVSNHGGRQLDSVASTISKLPGVVERVGARCEVYVDGGVRSGVDVFKALALGARGVMIGRPWAWAVAGAGGQGVGDLLATFKRELSVSMALAGVTRIEQIGRHAIDE